MKFMARKGGVVHVVNTKAHDMKHSKCPSVKTGHTSVGWRGKGMSPEAALALKPCVRCQTHELAQQAIEGAKTPAQKRAEAKERAQATMDKMKPKSKTKPKKERKPFQRKTAEGLYESMVERAEEHLAEARKHGWKGEVIQEDGSVKVEATKKQELLRLIYINGRITHARVTLASGAEVRLRSSQNWLKYARGEMDVDDAPKVKAKAGTRRSGKARAAAEAEHADKTNSRKLPFSMDDDDDIIIKSLAGKMITWRNSISGSLESARVPVRSRNSRISTHPKSQKRMISFYELQGNGEHGELLGGERVVLLERILRAKA